MRRAVRRIRGAREAPLFAALAVDPAGEPVAADDRDVVLYRGWLARPRADALLAEVRATTAWRRERRRMYDRIVAVPREQAWAGDGGAGDARMGVAVAAVRDELERLTGVRFPHVLLNRYRDGDDGVAWHHDREVAAVPRAVIASLTLGATRAFDVRPVADRARVVSVDLDHGDLVVMRGASQSAYEHRVPRDRRVGGERINLTFRQSGATRSIEQEFDARPRRPELR